MTLTVEQINRVQKNFNILNQNIKEVSPSTLWESLGFDICLKQKESKEGYYTFKQDDYFIKDTLCKEGDPRGSLKKHEERKSFPLKLYPEKYLKDFVESKDYKSTIKHFYSTRVNISSSFKAIEDCTLYEMFRRNEQDSMDFLLEDYEEWSLLCKRDFLENKKQLKRKFGEVYKDLKNSENLKNVKKEANILRKGKEDLFLNMLRKEENLSILYKPGTSFTFNNVSHFFPKKIMSFIEVIPYLNQGLLVNKIFCVEYIKAVASHFMKESLKSEKESDLHKYYSWNLIYHNFNIEKARDTYQNNEIKKFSLKRKQRCFSLLQENKFFCFSTQDLESAIKVLELFQIKEENIYYSELDLLENKYVFFISLPKKTEKDSWDRFSHTEKALAKKGIKIESSEYYLGKKTLKLNNTFLSKPFTLCNNKIKYLTEEEVFTLYYKEELKVIPVNSNYLNYVFYPEMGLGNPLEPSLKVISNEYNYIFLREKAQVNEDIIYKGQYKVEEGVSSKLVVSETINPDIHIINMSGTTLMERLFLFSEKEKENFMEDFLRVYNKNIGNKKSLKKLWKDNEGRNRVLNILFPIVLNILLESLGKLKYKNENLSNNISNKYKGIQGFQMSNDEICKIINQTLFRIFRENSYGLKLLKFGESTLSREDIKSLIESLNLNPNVIKKSLYEDILGYFPEDVPGQKQTWNIGSCKNYNLSIQDFGHRINSLFNAYSKRKFSCEIKWFNKTGNKNSFSNLMNTINKKTEIICFLKNKDSLVEIVRELKRINMFEDFSGVLAEFLKKNFILVDYSLKTLEKVLKRIVNIFLYISNKSGILENKLFPPNLNP